MAVRNYGKKILEFGKKFLVLSTGVFADPILLTEFVTLADEKCQDCDTYRCYRRNRYD